MGFTTDFNEGVRKRGIRMLSAGLGYMSSMGVVDTGETFEKARSIVKYSDNEAELIQLTMPRKGFIQMSSGGLGSTASRVGGKRRLTGGKPRNFLRKGIDENLEELGDFVSESFADKAVDNTKIGVKVRS